MTHEGTKTERGGRSRWQRGRRGPNWRRRNERESRAMDSRMSKNGNRRRRWPRGRRGNLNKGGGDGKSMILEFAEGGGRNVRTRTDILTRPERTTARPRIIVMRRESGCKDFP